MRVVCDTNVLVAGVVANGLCRDIVKRRLLQVELVTSRALLDELARTLCDKFETRLDELPWLQAHRERATLVRRVALSHPVCRDEVAPPLWAPFFKILCRTLPGLPFQRRYKARRRPQQLCPATAMIARMASWMYIHAHGRT